MTSEGKKTNSIRFPRDLAADLHKQLGSGSWKMLHEQEANARTRSMAASNRRNFELARPLPSLPFVEQLLDVGYVASLFEEEGRRVGCEFGYLTPEGAASLRFGTFRFSTPVPLEPANLAKLAPLAQPGRTEFGVWPEGDVLVAWGLFHHGDQRFAIDLEHKPSYFSIRILAPGSFTVHFDQRLHLLFRRDHGHLFTSELDLLAVFRDRAGIGPPVATALCRLAHRMLAHGHGGAILIVEKNAKPSGVVMHPTLTPKTAPDRLLVDAMMLDERASSGSLREENEPIERYARRRLEIERAHDEALDFVASLTAVDGAVLLDNDLGLSGAGVTILTPDSSIPEEVVIEDPRDPGVERRDKPSSIGGNRHRSALCFCKQQEGLALAMVASQDGNLSLFARRPDGLVHAIRPYELGVGLDR
jgi:hypothetical protein